MMPELPFYSLDYQHCHIKDEVEQTLKEVYNSSWFILGEKVKLFEQQYAQYIGVKHCIGVGNGLDALTLSLRALGVGRGDEVLIPAHTFVATALAVTAVGAKPVLVDVDPNTYNIDPLLLERMITAHTKAVIVVHLYGLSCDMDQLLGITEKHGLFVVEDNAQATGSEYRGKKTGSMGHINAHSFYPTKNLGAIGDGGAITTNDDELAHKVRLLANYGSGSKYHHEIQGYNSRLDEIQAAVLSIKLKYVDQWIEEKRKLAKVYQRVLQAVSGVVCPLLPTDEHQHSHHLYVIKSSQRDALAEHLKSQNIQTLIHYPVPIYQQKAFNGLTAERYPVTSRLKDEVLSLPLFPGLTIEQIENIVFQMGKFTL